MKKTLLFVSLLVSGVSLAQSVGINTTGATADPSSMLDISSTSKGILEKYTPGDIEFDAPKKLVDMLKAKDFGQYADKDGELHACFLTDNDITGGNSGSPVINGRGELIGTAFDGNWEAIASDFGFDANLQRTISLDIRYTLFIMDKFGGAGYLLNEMKIVK
jgi:hypothetical protein